jgi:hypothetical protein
MLKPIKTKTARAGGGGTFAIVASRCKNRLASIQSSE